MFALGIHGTGIAAIYPGMTLSAMNPRPHVCRAGGDGAAPKILPALMTARARHEATAMPGGEGGTGFPLQIKPPQDKKIKHSPVWSKQLHKRATLGDGAVWSGLGSFPCSAKHGVLGTGSSSRDVAAVPPGGDMSLQLGLRRCKPCAAWTSSCCLITAV